MRSQTKNIKILKKSRGKAASGRSARVRRPRSPRIRRARGGTMACSISGEMAMDPVVSLKSGHLFERALIEKQIAATGRCPITNQDLSKSDLLAVQTHKNQRSAVVRPRVTGTAGVPGLIKALQDEWDALMLESYNLKRHLADIRQELAYALYQKDAACRVIARLVKERDEARAALGDVQANMAAAVGRPSASGSGAEGSGSMDVVGGGDDEQDSNGIPKSILQNMAATADKLRKDRKPRVKALQARAARPDAVAAYEATGSHPLHSSSKPGILCVDLHPKSPNLVATGGVDSTTVLFDTSSGKKVDTLRGHKKRVNAVRFHPTQNAVFTASADGTVAVWGPGRGRNKFKKQSILSDGKAAVRAISLDPSGAYLAVASADGGCRLWDVETASIVARIGDGDGEGEFLDAGLHPDGLLLATARKGDSGKVRIFDLNAGRGRSGCYELEGHGQDVASVAFSENGYHMASADVAGVVRLWDLRKLKCLALVSDLPTPLNSVAFDSSGSLLLTAGSDVRAFAVAKKALSPVKTWTQHKKAVMDARFGPDAGFIVSVGMDRTLKTYGK